MLFIWLFFSLMFVLVYLKSFMMILLILNIEYFSIILIFTVMLNLNNSNNSMLMSIILLIFFSIESIFLLSFYINFTRFNSKDYIMFFKV